jgi:hypothetical protein
MISSTLLTMAFFICTGSSDFVTTDEVSVVDSHIIQVHGRIEDRIGNRIQLSGFPHRLLVSPGVKIPRRGRRDRSPLLQLTLLKQPHDWIIIKVGTSVAWDRIMKQHRSRIDQLPADHRELVCRFLLRESPHASQGSLWRSLELVFNDEPLRWIRLGGEFLSSQKLLSEEIDKRNFRELATRAGLYLQRGDWISRSDFFRLNRLRLVDGQVCDVVRIELKELAAEDLDRLLKQSKKDHVVGEVQAGASRKSVRALWGDPREVTWVQWNSHILEQWQYPGQIVRIIDGRVCTVHSQDENPSR